MNPKRVTHSKFKNTGILFELLVRQVTADTVGGKTSSPSLRLLREYFSPSTELGKEMQLYRVLVDGGNLSEPKALKLIDIVGEQRKRLNMRKLNLEKYNLIKEIKGLYSIKDFLSSKIPQYKTYASVYKTFLADDASLNPADISEVTNARFTLVEHLVNKKKDTPEAKSASLIETYKAQQEDLRLLSYRMLVERFNSKYKNLSEEQKVLLREYINNISNTNLLREYINKEVPKVKKAIADRIKFIPSKVTQIKLHEVVSQLDELTKGKTVRDNQVTALMIAYQLLREVNTWLNR